MTRTEELRVRLLGTWHVQQSARDRLWGWLGPIAIALVGGLLRFWSLGRPTRLIFDETYYVKQAISMLRFGVEMNVLEDLEEPNDLWNAGNQEIWDTTGDFVVHPPVGKWVIAFGQWIFGHTSTFGWRFSAALLGTISILIIGRVARRLFGSTLLGCVAAFLLAFEGHHFTHSRIGLLDLIVMFFALAAFAALLIDRDASREVLARAVGAQPAGTAMAYGPWLGWRPWRWVAGIMLGLCIGTKWSGLYVLAVFGLLTVWWDMSARRSVGVRHWARSALLKDGPFAFLAMVGTALVVYVGSWVGWFRSEAGYRRDWAAQNPSETFGWVPDGLRSLWEYHRAAYTFHVGLDSEHPYMANPWNWIVQGRPTSFYWETQALGEDGCPVEKCASAISSVGTVPTWWLGTVGLAFLLYHWALRRDWRAGAILAGFAGLYLPWFTYQERTIYGFYSVAFVPFVVLSATFVLALVLGRERDTFARKQLGLLVVGLFLLLVLFVFFFFWPIYTAQVIPYDQWRLRMWFPSWV
ncbi:MAG: phospholipid carrier-dependent glycosyltransferase [Actinomycetia bacterium]|nr:phospholipid carrier-dependent glycosyltransferase [Actinomycetes bacterium]